MFKHVVVVFCILFSSASFAHLGLNGADVLHACASKQGIRVVSSNPAKKCNAGEKGVHIPLAPTIVNNYVNNTTQQLVTVGDAVETFDQITIDYVKVYADTLYTLPIGGLQADMYVTWMAPKLRAPSHEVSLTVPSLRLGEQLNLFLPFGPHGTVFTGTPNLLTSDQIDQAHASACPDCKISIVAHKADDVLNHLATPTNGVLLGCYGVGDSLYGQNNGQGSVSHLLSPLPSVGKWWIYIDATTTATNTCAQITASHPVWHTDPSGVYRTPGLTYNEAVRIRHFAEVNVLTP